MKTSSSVAAVFVTELATDLAGGFLRQSTQVMYMDDGKSVREHQFYYRVLNDEGRIGLVKTNAVTPTGIRRPVTGMAVKVGDVVTVDGAVFTVSGSVQVPALTRGRVPV